MQIKKRTAKLPDAPGIYRFYDKEGELLYVGKAISIKKRVSSYFASKNLGAKTDLMVKKIADIKYIKVFSEFEALLLEAQLIRENQPFFNTISKDDKSPLYIKITNDEIPLVQVTRLQKKQRGVFLKGPFPSSKTTREVLRIIRRIFPYCHHKNPKKPCLYVHLGLCPFPYKDEQAEQKYLKDIERVKKLLSGKSRSLIRELKKEMADLAREQKFEEAGTAKKKIQKLEYITTSYHTPAEFLERPTLVDDLTLTRLKDLKTQLGLKKIPKRIECYDISNIGGELATGSMVVFENGQAAKHEYRRFKIKFSKKPDDYQMLAEVLARRFKNDWKAADLIVIDGGRGQLNTALRVTDKLRLNTKVVALAKKFEEIYTPDKILPISLPKESLARQLLEAMRDEAHRFAITYHRLLRSKQFIS